MSESPLLFLDANTLASPVTRTLVIAGARADGLRWTWSAHVEAEADAHVRGAASRTSAVREQILGTDLSPTARSTKGLVTKTLKDRQVAADAIRATARFLITTEVDDFALEDLAAHEMSAVNPEYFMALRFTEQAYREGVGLLAAYDTIPVPADEDQPSVLFRGVSCIRCDAQLDGEESLRVGMCAQHFGIPVRTTP